MYCVRVGKEFGDGDSTFVRLSPQRASLNVPLRTNSNDASFGNRTLKKFENIERKRYVDFPSPESAFHKVPPTQNGSNMTSNYWDGNQQSRATKWRGGNTAETTDDRNMPPGYQINAKPQKSPERTLYRSNSSLDIDAVETQEISSSRSLRRTYGSTSSLDLLESDNRGENGLFTVIQKYKTGGMDQRSPATPQMQQVFRQPVSGSTPDLNGGATGENKTDQIDGSVSPKVKHKLKKKEDRKSRKSNAGEGGRGFLWKLKSSNSSGHESGKSSDNSIELSESRSDEKLRQKAFIHYDCQSIIVNHLEFIKNKHNLNKRRPTGASAASAQQVSLKTEDTDEETDDGDDRSNSLVLSCPFFRNELGGEEEKTISLTRASGQNQQFYGSQTLCDPTRRRPSCNGVAILDMTPLDDGSKPNCVFDEVGYLMEYVDYGSSHYRQFFYSHDHQNYFGVDDNLGPVAISVRRDKLIDDDQNIKPENIQQFYRVIVRSSELYTLRGFILEETIPVSSRLGNNRPVPIKELLEYIVPEIQISCLRLGNQENKKAMDQLLKLDELPVTKEYKVGVMYCKAGQSTEEEMYNNEFAGPAFEEFLETIGTVVRLKGFEGYRAGLDNKTDSTGLHSLYTKYRDCEIMFHVSTMLPFTPNNKQQLLRKRHIGNDMVTIVFQEPNALPFTPKTVRSHFQHVFIIVQVSSPNTDHVRYSIAVSRSKEVPQFGPPISENNSYLINSKDFVDLLLIKCLNGENAVHHSERFVAMAVRTRQEYLKDLATNYVTQITLESSGSKLGKFGLGSGRKREKNRQKLIPYMSAKGAIVWNVQAEDFSLSQQVDCLLGISSDIFVLIHEQTKEVIFTTPCRNIIGWTQQSSGLRLYYDHGECIAFKIQNSDPDEILEIVARLQSVTGGSETMEMTLQRNQKSELGFTVQYEGIISKVDPTCPAFLAGLRQGCRLVEICKVATATLTHDQMVDLLRTSVTIKVIIIPQDADGFPRRGCSDHSASNFAQSQNFHKTLVSRLQADLNTPRNTNSYADRYQSSNPSSRQSLMKDYADISNLHDTSRDWRNPNPPSRQSLYRDYMDPNEVLHQRSKTEDPKPRGEGNSATSRFVSRSWESPNQSYSSQDSIEHSGRETRDSRDKEYRDINDMHHQDRANDRANQGIYLSRYVVNGHGYSPLNVPLPPPRPSRNTPEIHHGSELEIPKSRGRVHDRSTSSSNLSQLSDMSSHSAGSGPPGSPKDHGSSRKQQFLSPGGKQMWRVRDASPGSTNSSPRTNRSSDDNNLAHRLRPGVSLVSGIRPTEALRERSFQEELMRLIDPELSEADIREGKPSSRPASFAEPNNRPGLLQRTLSDESLCGFQPYVNTNNKLEAPDRAHSGTISSSSGSKPSIVTMSTPKSQRLADHRLSPRVTAGTPTNLKKPTVRSESSPNMMPLPDPENDLEWSNLVDTARKALDDEDDHKAVSVEVLDRIGSEDHEDNPIVPARGHQVRSSVRKSYINRGPSPWRPPPDVNSSKSENSALDPTVQELRERCARLENELEKERHRNFDLKRENDELRNDNIRLSEESQAAAMQLRKFTEWFFTTIDGKET